MTRKITALITATLLLFALLPVGVALAEATATARLTAGLDVFPGASRGFQIQVNNNESPAVLPIPGLPSGNRIRFVQIILPSNAGIRTAAGGYTAPSGWSVHPGSSGPLQTVTFRTDGDGIAPGANLAFPFPATVLAPVDGDRSGTFRVTVSSHPMGGDDTVGTKDAGAPLTGTLTSKVRVLEVLPGTLRATAPAGATDGSATTGQTITYAFDVRNHATRLSGLTVQPTLSSSNSGDTITQGSPVNIGPNGVETLTSAVQLGSASADRTSTFTAQAAATDAVPSAQSLTQTAGYTVHALVRLVYNFGAFDPKYVQNVDPTTYTFKLPVTKQGTQSLTLDAGTLTFCGNEVALQTPVVFPGGSDTQTLSFGPIESTSIDSGGLDRRQCNGDFVLSGPDGNGFHTELTRSESNLINIDNLIPVIELDITLPTDEDGVRQTMAKDGDTIRVDGTIDTGCATLDWVALAFTDGREIVRREASQVSCTGGAFNTSFTGVTFGTDEDEFLALAQGTSPANRAGTGDSEEIIKIDNLVPTFTEAITILIDQGPHAGDYGVLVRFTENNVLLGACSTQLWDVSGQGGQTRDLFGSVEQVLYSNGQPCQPGQSGPDNDRILVIGGLDSRDDTPDVLYTPVEPEVTVPGAIQDAAAELPVPMPNVPFFTTDRAKDGAGNYTAETLIRAVVGIVPAVPDLGLVTRANGGEEARFFDGAYWTRFAGNDMQVGVSGARVNYAIEVLDGTIDGDECIPGTRLSIQPAAGEEDWVGMAIPPAEGTYVRAIRLINDAGAGPAACITVGLDQTAPQIASSSALGLTQHTAFLSEHAWGVNVASAWFVWEEVEHRDDQPIGGRDYYGATGVSGSGDQRSISANRAGNGPFGGVDYRPGDFDSRRLEDKAGNLLANTVQFD